jgi:hypothetical protein
MKKKVRLLQEHRLRWTQASFFFSKMFLCIHSSTGFVNGQERVGQNLDAFHYICKLHCSRYEAIRIHKLVRWPTWWMHLLTAHYSWCWTFACAVPRQSCIEHLGLWWVSISQRHSWVLNVTLNHPYTHPLCPFTLAPTNSDCVSNVYRQEAFMENYFANQRDHIFRNVEVLIYVFDVESREVERDFHYFQSCLEAIGTHSRTAKIYCLIHKMDLVPDNVREKVRRCCVCCVS